MAVGVGLKAPFRLNGVAPQNEYVVNAQKVEIDQGILGFFFGKSAANDVGHGVYPVFVDDSGTDANGAGPLAGRYFF